MQLSTSIGSSNVRGSISVTICGSLQSVIIQPLHVLSFFVIGRASAFFLRCLYIRLFVCQGPKASVCSKMFVKSFLCCHYNVVKVVLLLTIPVNVYWNILSIILKISISPSLNFGTFLICLEKHACHTPSHSSSKESLSPPHIIQHSSNCLISRTSLVFLLL